MLTWVEKSEKERISFLSSSQTSAGGALLERESLPHNLIHLENPPTPSCVYLYFCLKRIFSSGGLFQGPGGRGWCRPPIPPHRLEGIHRIHLLGFCLQREWGRRLQRGDSLPNVQRHSRRPSTERHHRICIVLLNHW